MTARTNQREALLQTIERKRDLADRFERIERVDGDGGGGHFSLVTRAWDRQRSEWVALKFFDPAHRTDLYRWEAFKRETEILPGFAGKPDILQCRCVLSEFEEIFTNPVGIQFPVQFAYYGVELADYDASFAMANRQWSATQKLEYFRMMCRAVQRIHREFIVHRDLKPSNFLIMSDKTLRLSDFGTARLISPLKGGLLSDYSGPPGDLRYASPEMMANLHGVDPAFAFKADIYALGAILFELFTGAVLNVQALPGDVLRSLNQAMNAVRPEHRIQTYDSFVAHLSSAHPLPSVGLFGGQTPPSLVDLIDRLYKSMAALNYQERQCDFAHIFLQVQTCLYVLRHEAAYRRWREQRKRRRTKSVRQIS